MDSRIQALLETLAFIADIRYPNRETAFRASLYFGEVRRQRIDPARIRIGDYEAQHHLTFIDELRERVQKMSQSRDPLEAFQRFSVLESDFEPIEDDVHELEGELDYMIQMEIDRIRGK